MNRSRRRTNDAEDEPNNVETPPPRSTLGANLEPNAGFQEAVLETEEMAKKCTSHGTRKGGATKITTGATHPPPTPFVAARGEWSIGQALQLPWHF